MKNHLLADRYARALSESIEDLAELEATSRTLREFARFYAGSHDLQNAVNNPAARKEDRAALLGDVLKKLEMPGRVIAFVQLLMQRGRIGILADVVSCFDQHTDTRMNRVGATAWTAVPLPEAAREQLQRSLERYSGKQVRLECEVDPAVVGGVKVRMGGLLLDGTLRTRLTRLTEMLLSSDMIKTTAEPVDAA